MQQSKSLALLFLLGAVVAGAAIGVAGDRVLEHNRPRPMGRRGGLERMARELNLTTAQKAAFDSILENRQTQLRQLYAPVQPQIDSLDAAGKVIRDSTHEQLRRVLNPDQRAKFDKMHEEAMKRGADARRRFKGPRSDSGPPGR